MTNLSEAFGGRPESANYPEFSEGFRALLLDTDRRAPRSAAAKNRAAGEHACAVTGRYLQETFLGSYLGQLRTSPVYLHNASSLMTAIRYLEAQGSLRRFHGAYFSRVELDSATVAFSGGHERRILSSTGSAAGLSAGRREDLGGVTVEAR